MPSAMPCACNSAAKFDFSRPLNILSGYEHAKLMVGHCDHVGVEELRDQDYGVAAVFFAHCSDTPAKPRQCGPATDKLLLFGLRTGWKSRRSVISRVEVTAVPAKSLVLEGESPDSPTGTSVRNFEDPDVVWPRSNQIEEYTWHRDIAVRVQRSAIFVKAAINVRLDVTHGPDTRQRAITLNVGVPSGGAVNPVEQSLALLSSPIAQMDKLVLVRIGDNTFSLSESQAISSQLDGEISPQFLADQTPVLNGLNTKLNHLLIHKGSLIANEVEAEGSVRASIQTKITICNQTIAATEKEILEVVNSINRVNILIGATRALTEPQVAEFVAGAETEGDNLLKWAGTDRAALAIVFTDIVGYTTLNQKMGDKITSAVRDAHFRQSRALINHWGGREVKTIGDSFMVVFKSVGPALDYAMDLSSQTGHGDVRIRAGIHVGSLGVEKEDIFGTEVNKAARILSSIRGPEIWMSDRAKEDLHIAGAHESLTWEEHSGTELKSFPDKVTLWSLKVG